MWKDGMMQEDDKLIRGVPSIVCPDCRNRSNRVGAQDDCDHYVCEEGHLTRVRILAPREEWKDATD